MTSARKQISEQFLSAMRSRSSVAGLPVSPRGKVTLEGIITDAWIEDRGLQRKDIEKALDSDEVDTSFIDKLWYHPENQDVVQAFMNNKLCRAAARGEEDALKAYKTYAVQDYFYLIDYVKFKALRLVTVPLSDLETLETETASVGNSFGYAKDWYLTCTEDLGIPLERFHDERSIAELAYANFLQNNTGTEDWFNLHVILIACNFGWSRLALYLYHQEDTDRTTEFYKTWIEPNLDLTDPEDPQLSPSAVKLANFLAVNAQLWSSPMDWKTYPSLFRTSLRLEVAMFNAGYEDLCPRVVN